MVGTTTCAGLLLFYTLKPIRTKITRMEMPEECLFEDAEAMKSLMLHVVSEFLLETNLRVFSCSATGILRGQGHYSLEFT